MTEKEAIKQVLNAAHIQRHQIKPHSPKASTELGDALAIVEKLLDQRNNIFRIAQIPFKKE